MQWPCAERFKGGELIHPEGMDRIPVFGAFCSTVEDPESLYHQLRTSPATLISLWSKNPCVILDYQGYPSSFLQRGMETRRASPDF